MNQSDDKRNTAQELVSSIQNHQSKDELQNSKLPKALICLSGLIMASTAWRCHSLDESAGELKYFEARDLVDTAFVADWKRNKTFLGIRDRDIKRALDALRANELRLATQNFIAAGAALTYPSSVLYDYEQRPIFRSQLVREILPLSRDDLKPDTVQYSLSFENIPESPYTLLYGKGTDDTVPEGEIFIGEKKIGELHCVRDEEMNVRAWYVRDPNGTILYEERFAKELRIGMIHFDFIQKKEPEPK